VQIGIAYPQNELRGDPAAVRRFGRAVEDIGFDYLLAYDHVLGAVHADRTRQLPGPYNEHDPFHDPFVMFGYLAGVTERLGFDDRDPGPSATPDRTRRAPGNRC
jgi:alkanesulfonate monooxygenase SsuD/methylene tetrahydromethanopterin reductase-like flavin-dependent oxidoreductase (luciferase family)